MDPAGHVRFCLAPGIGFSVTVSPDRLRGRLDDANHGSDLDGRSAVQTPTTRPGVGLEAHLFGDQFAEQGAQFRRGQDLAIAAGVIAAEDDQVAVVAGQVDGIVHVPDGDIVGLSGIYMEHNGLRNLRNVSVPAVGLELTTC